MSSCNEFADVLVRTQECGNLCNKAKRHGQLNQFRRNDGFPTPCQSAAQIDGSEGDACESVAHVCPEHRLHNASQKLSNENACGVPSRDTAQIKRQNTGTKHIYTKVQCPP
jgi:hypothetical protein